MCVRMSCWTPWCRPADLAERLSMSILAFLPRGCSEGAGLRLAGPQRHGVPDVAVSAERAAPAPSPGAAQVVPTEARHSEVNGGPVAQLAPSREVESTSRLARNGLSAAVDWGRFLRGCCLSDIRGGMHAL